MSDSVCVFGVFDGHGGNEVSLWVKENFIPVLTKLEAFKCQRYLDALKDIFPKLDEMLLEPEHSARLKQISALHGAVDPFAGGQVRDSENLAQLTGCTATVLLVT